LAAIVITWGMGRELEAPRERSLGPVLLAGTAAATAVLLGMAAVLQLEGAAQSVAVAGAIAFGCAAVTAGVGALRYRPRWVYGSVAAATATTFLMAVLLLLPAIGRRKSAAPLIEAVPELSSGRPLVTVEIRVPSLTFYLGRMPEVIEMEDLAEQVERDDAPLFVITDVDLEAVPAQILGNLREIGRQGKFSVYEIGDP
jgi:hypothetical protein